MNLNRCTEIAHKMAAKAKPGFLKIDDDLYTFEFDQKHWVYQVYKNGFEYIRFNCKKLSVAKKYLKEHLAN